VRICDISFCPQQQTVVSLLSMAHPPKVGVQHISTPERVCNIFLASFKIQIKYSTVENIH
jgi:hypothetical protein